MTIEQLDAYYYSFYHKAIKAFDSGDQVKGWFYTSLCNRVLTAKLKLL